MMQIVLREIRARENDLQEDPPLIYAAKKFLVWSAGQRMVP